MLISKKRYEEMIHDHERLKHMYDRCFTELERLKTDLAQGKHTPGAECECCKHLIKEDRRPLGCVYHCKLNNKCIDFEDKGPYIVKITPENFNEAVKKVNEYGEDICDRGETECTCSEWH